MPEKASASGNLCKVWVVFEVVQEWTPERLRAGGGGPPVRGYERGLGAIATRMRLDTNLIFKRDLILSARPAKRGSSTLHAQPCQYSVLRVRLRHVEGAWGLTGRFQPSCVTKAFGVHPFEHQQVRPPPWQLGGNLLHLREFLNLAREPWQSCSMTTDS